MRVPAGLLLTMAVCMVPLLTFGIERWTASGRLGEIANREMPVAA